MRPRPYRATRSLASLSLALLAGSAAAQTISSLSAASAARSERLIVSGTGFGATQGQSQLLIGGVPAVVTYWSDTKIRAHIAESTPLGAGPVLVLAPSPSNELQLTVTPRASNAEGHILWKLRTDHLYSVSRPAIGPDGTIYISGVGGPVYAVAPDGGVRWTIQNAGGMRPVCVATDGTVYVVGAGASITAAWPDGQTRWQYSAPSNAGPIFVGPNVGPDGKIYAVTEEEPGLGTDHGAFALNPDGSFAWSHSGGYNFRGSPVGWEIAFSGDMLVFPTGQGTPLNGNTGVHGLRQSTGHEDWLRVGIAKVQSDQNGFLYWLGAINNNYIGSYNAQGNERWTIIYNTFWGQPGGFVVAPDGSSFYGTSTMARFAGINADGSVRWTLAPGHQIQPFGVTRDGQSCIAAAYQYSPTIVKLQLRAASNGGTRWEQPFPYENSVWMSPSWEGALSRNGRVFYLMGTGNNYINDPYCYLYAIDVSNGAPACDPDVNCDGSINGFDIEAVEQAVNGDMSNFCQPDADYNQDGTVNGFDIEAVEQGVNGAPCP
ncbi:Desiccation/radiation resistance protein [Phycisphaerales bacterium]|nr:Desiccation/radiation resistance protein [Phycisphaerales bacterium]